MGLVLLFHLPAQGQAKKQRLLSGDRDWTHMVVCFPECILVDEDHQVEVVDLKSRRSTLSQWQFPDSVCKALGKGQGNTVLFVDKKRQVWSCQKGVAPIQVGTAPDAVRGLLQLSSGEVVLVLAKGVQVGFGTGLIEFPSKEDDQPAKRVVNLGETGATDSIPKLEQGFLSDGRTEMHADRLGRLWIGKNKGEWGGDLLCLDLKTRTWQGFDYSRFSVDRNPVKGFLEYGHSFWVLTGCSHMGIRHGTICQLQGRSWVPVLETERFYKYRERKFIGKGWEIGPACVLEKDGTLILATDEGLRKAPLKALPTDPDAWKSILRFPKLYPMRDPDADPKKNKDEDEEENLSEEEEEDLDNPFEVVQLEALPNGHVLWMTANHGLGIWNGRRVRLIR